MLLFGCILKAADTFLDNSTSVHVRTTLGGRLGHYKRNFYNPKRVKRSIFVTDSFTLKSMTAADEVMLSPQTPFSEDPKAFQT